MSERMILRMLGELPIDKRERLIVDQLAQLTELPDKAAKRIETISIGELSTEIIEHHKTFGKFTGLTSGYRYIDQHLTKGFVGGEMTVLAGATSNGKTAMSINMAVRIAQAGHKVLFVTLEMTQTELGSRIYHVYRNMGTNFTELQIIMQKNDELDWQDIDPLIEKAKEQGVEIVFIDHLHYFTRDTEHQNEALARISKEIKKNAIRHNIPIVLLAQTRKSTGNGDHELTNEEISGSFAIAQDADIVLFVQRKKERPNEILVKMTKNRNRGHDFNEDSRWMYFHETIIIDPEHDQVDPQTRAAIDDYYLHEAEALQPPTI